MLDLGTLESQTDRQILFKLIGLITGLIAIQHRDRYPSSTPAAYRTPFRHPTASHCLFSAYRRNMAHVELPVRSEDTANVLSVAGPFRLDGTADRR